MSELVVQTDEGWVVVDEDLRPNDTEKGRLGCWMHTSLGGRFWPLDPRSEEVFISDIANGLACDWRYAGQGRTDRFYSVAEHCVHVCRAVIARYGTEDVRCTRLALAALLHDAAEAYINDVNRATKRAIGLAYKEIEGRINRVVWAKYGVLQIFENPELEAVIKGIDCRIVPLEKAAIMAHSQPWAYDTYEPLDDVKIECWNATLAKVRFLREFEMLASRLNLPHEEIEL